MKVRFTGELEIDGLDEAEVNELREQLGISPEEMFFEEAGGPVCTEATKYIQADMVGETAIGVVKRLRIEINHTDN